MNIIKDMLRVTLFGSDNAASSTGTRAFDPARDIPSLSDKTILITGAAGDLGRQTAIELIRYGRPKRVYIADLPLNEREQEALLARINEEAYALDDPSSTSSSAKPRTDIRFLDLDLGSFASVRRCAERFTAQEERLDILILNAGIIRVSPGVTAEGYEVHFGINYLGHALLTMLLMPVLLRSAERVFNDESKSDVRIVVVSSEGYVFAPEGGVDFEAVRTDCASLPYSKRYGQSKVALLGLMQNLSRSCPQIKTVAIHPGRILTGMARSLQQESWLAYLTQPIAPLFCVPVSTGIRNHLWAATSPDVVSGAYYEPVGVRGVLTGAANGEGFAEQLGKWTDGVFKGVDGLKGV
ncbi:NAD(P)-binding protein [Aspergillus karnatakaensis]|uniref:NAD(P)-binding protein n=1 Tax=Aspergillus karnatakaensis TaxID=1810916 RepID=UPI003CCC90BE